MKREELKKFINKFIKKWEHEEGTEWRDTAPKGKLFYNDFAVKASFGQSTRMKPPKFPWIAFLKFNQKVSKGIYPIIFYNEENKTLMTKIGISYEKTPEIDDSVIKKIKSNSKENKFDIEEIDQVIELLEENMSIFNSKFNEYEINEETLDYKKDNTEEKIETPLNQILYGPPGTGKTYNTINKALEIIDKEFYLENKENRNILKGKFDEYRSTGQIEVITFHQSYGYEEFVEGIRAETDGDKNLNYNIKGGVFKELCNKAQNKKFKSEGKNFESDAKVWKISLGGSREHWLKKECFENNEIRIGWGGIELGTSSFENLGAKDKNSIDSFINKMSEGDIVVSLYSHKEIDGIGIVTGEYEEIKDENINYRKRRSVTWLVKDKVINFLEINGGIKIGAPTVYGLDRVKSEELLEFLDKKEVIQNNLDQSYVLIIDEINRGNISKIFGELITLIEDNKRIGNDEATEVTLPYSGKRFGVPNNLYILGTMNTADRSIALLDTALRRRFDFVEMMPQPFIDGICTNISDENGNNLEIDVQKVLNIINNRIEYLYDRDHAIGHAYFIGVETKRELDSIMKNKIIPLLQEYFYDDWEKIQLVLGDHEKQFDKSNTIDRFIISKKLNDEKILGFSYEEITGEETSYKINNDFTSKAYKKIYEKVSGVSETQYTEDNPNG